MGERAKIKRLRHYWRWLIRQEKSAAGRLQTVQMLLDAKGIKRAEAARLLAQD